MAALSCRLLEGCQDPIRPIVDEEVHRGVPRLRRFFLFIIVYIHAYIHTHSLKHEDRGGRPPEEATGEATGCVAPALRRFVVDARGAQFLGGIVISARLLIA